MPKCNCLNLYKSGSEVLCKDEKILVCILKNAKKQCLVRDVLSEIKGGRIERRVLIFTSVLYYENVGD
jgi:hypothetical protein